MTLRLVLEGLVWWCAVSIGGACAWVAFVVGRGVRRARRFDAQLSAAVASWAEAANVASPVARERHRGPEPQGPEAPRDGTPQTPAAKRNPKGSF